MRREKLRELILFPLQLRGLAQRQQAVAHGEKAPDLVEDHRVHHAEVPEKRTGDADEIGAHDHPPAALDVSLQVSGDVAQVKELF